MSAGYDLDALAIVDPVLGGWAQAFAFMDFFYISFEVIAEEVVYLGATPLNNGAIVAGTVIGPGYYAFTVSDYLNVTAEPGESIRHAKSASFDFRLVPVPAPAAGWLLGSAILLLLGSASGRSARR